MRLPWIALTVMLIAGSCTHKPDPAKSCLVSGSVNPAVAPYITLTYNEFLDSAKITKNLFEAKVPCNEAGLGMIFYNEKLVEVYFEPGKSLELNFSAADFPDKIEFGGDIGPVNHYLQLSRRLDRQTGISSNELYSKEPGDFLAYLDSVRNLKTRLLNEYINKYPEIDSLFSRKRAADIIYSWASQQLLYPGYYALITNRIPPLPENYHGKYIESLELENPDMLISPAFRTFLENYLDFKEALYIQEHPEVEKLWFPGSVARFRIIHEEFTNVDIKDYLLFRAMGEHLDNFGTDHVETFITNFRISCTNEEYKAAIEEKFSRNESLARGEPAPELKFFNRKGEKVLLSSFKDSILYLNFWASWAEWSIQEFPYWEKLRKDFSGKPVKFISVSMDFATDRNKWDYILDKQALGGLHLINDPSSGAFKDRYFINELPRYLLIDPEGKIISAHAPRPSENMEDVLNKLLAK